MTDGDADDAPDTYRTVAGPGQADFEVRGSEFVGYVSPAETVADAETFIRDVESEHPDATHNVPAYRVPADPSKADVLLREWCSDDGEPAGSSGKPALNVLVQREIRNVVAVVTRYYGGTNLGVGGLARAYSRAVKEAVDDAGVVEERPHERFRAVVAYDDSGTVRGILESTGAEFEADYDEQVSFEVRVPVADAAALRDRLRSATSGRVDLS
jgi:uncharacterized YigZ family protein